MKVFFALFVLLLSATVAPSMEIKRDNLVGAWSYVSTYSEFKDGRKENIFGAKPVGMFVILPNGHYSHIIMHPELPKVRSNRVRDMTIAEAERIAEGTLAHFGTYTVNETAGSFTVKITKASFPNLDGRSQVRTILQLDDETLSYINDVSVAEEGAKVVAVLRRVQ